MQTKCFDASVYLIMFTLNALCIMKIWIS